MSKTNISTTKTTNGAGPKERRFLDALCDLFVGAKVDGQSGYINLMKIKASYFTGLVEPALMKDIAAALEDFPNFREELFDKLHAFFSRYFSRSGSICFAYTPSHFNVYEKVYTDAQDATLFWKTHMLHYVKTDRLFQDMRVEVDDEAFFFDCSELQHKKANEKRRTVCFFDKLEEDGTIRLVVTYPGNGQQTDVAEILKVLKKADHAVRESTLTKAIKVFDRQCEVDFFINKDAGKFLREQFDLWMYQYMFQEETDWPIRRVQQLQALKAIALKIIDFIAQFEDELVRVWNKPKFVRGSHYVVTLDRLADKQEGLDVIAELIKHKGMSDQVAEWVDLGIVKKGFDPKTIMQGIGKNRKLAEDWQFLPIDTKHFATLELKLIGLFDNLDEELDGRLIKSDNYQALNTLGNKYHERIDFTYIDPPYNTAASEIIYENRYKHASWLSLVIDRLRLNFDLLKETGITCITIDDAESHRLHTTVEDTFPETEMLGTAVIRNNPAGRSTVKGFSTSHEYGIFIAKSGKGRIGRIERTPEQLARYDKEDEFGFYEVVNFRKHGGANAMRDARRRLFYPIYAKQDGFRIPQMNWDEKAEEWLPLEEPNQEESVIYPVSDDGAEKTWKWGHETAQANSHDLLVRKDQSGNLGIYMKSRLGEGGRLPSTWWADSKYSSSDYGTNLLTNLFGESQLFSFPKSIHATADSIKVAAPDENAMILDFFAGSGTTAHAVIELNREDHGKRKYVLCEVGSHFDDVLLPRIKKISFSKDWKKGLPSGDNGSSHFVKYSSLEQYEDALATAIYSGDEGDLFRDPDKNPYTQYVFLRDEKHTKVIDLEYKQDDYSVDLNRLYPDIDLAETLSCVTGKWIKRITAEEVEFADGSRESLVKPGLHLLKPLIFWDHKPEGYDPEPDED